MYHQPSFRKVSGFFEENERKGAYANSYEPGPKDSGHSFKSANLQEIFLNNCRKNENTVSIELIHGARRIGRIIGFDSQSVILSGDNTQLLIYKSAISAVVPEIPVQYIFNEIHKKEYFETINQI